MIERVLTWGVFTALIAALCVSVTWNYNYMFKNHYYEGVLSYYMYVLIDGKRVPMNDRQVQELEEEFNDPWSFLKDHDKDCIELKELPGPPAKPSTWNRYNLI